MSYNFPLPPLYGLNFHPNDENGNVFGGFFPGRFPLPVIVQAPSSSGTFDSGSPPTSPSGSSELEEEDEEDDEEEEEDEEEGYSSEDQRSASEHGAPSSDRVSRSGPTSPQQPSTPDSAESYLAHYAANLPPSPIRHHYAGSFYPGQAMVQTRSSSRTYDQPPNAAQSARAGASSSRAGAEAPPSGATAGGSGGGGGGGASRTGRLPPGAPPSQPTRRAQPTQTSRRSQSRQPPPMIDLTLSSPSGPSTTTAKRSAAQGPARKKQKTSKALKKLSEDEREDEGENDADDDDDDADTEDDGFTMIPIEKPPAEDEKPKKLAGTACIICMEDEPVDLSITPCGHMFCNKCLFGAIKSTLPAPQKVHGKCPVCRGKVAIKDIIVLEIKKRSKGKDRA